MNLVDVVLLVALLYSAFRGYRQGALSQVAAFGGAAVGLVIGAALAPRLSSHFFGEAGTSLALLTMGLLLVFIAVGQGIGLAVGARLRRVAFEAGAAGVDRTAGVAVGVTGLLLTVWLLGSVLAQGPSPALAKQVQESRIATAVADAMPTPPDLFGRVGGYLDSQGFPTVFSGIGGAIAPPVDAPSSAAVAAAQQAGAPSTVQVLATGCGGISSGSGFVTRRGFVVTNAHVVAGGESLSVRDGDGEHDAVAVHVDTDIDLAVLRVEGLGAPRIRWTAEPSGRGVEGATLGFPGGQRRMEVKPAAVRSRSEAVGRNIYGGGVVTRDVLTLSAAVARGDSGGPFVTTDGRVGGVVFAAAAAEPGTGYALTAESVRPTIERVIERNEPAGTGRCRY